MSIFLAIVLGQLWGAAGHSLRSRTNLSPVVVSSSLTLAAALFLPRVFAEGYLFATICTSVSYVTMSSTKHLCRLWETLLVSVLCTLIVFFGQNILSGIGGRLGTFAALSVLIFAIPRAHKDLVANKRR